MKAVTRITITEPEVVDLVNQELQQGKVKTAARIVSNIVREHFFARRERGGNDKPKRPRSAVA